MCASCFYHYQSCDDGLYAEGEGLGGASREGEGALEGGILDVSALPGIGCEGVGDGAGHQVEGGRVRY